MKRMKQQIISFVIVFAMLTVFLPYANDSSIYAAAVEPYFTFGSSDGEPVTKVTVMKGYECSAYCVDSELKSDVYTKMPKWKSSDEKIVKITGQGYGSHDGYRIVGFKGNSVGKTRIALYDGKERISKYLTVVVKDRISLKIRGIKIKSKSVSFKVTNKSKTAIKMTGCAKDNFHFEDEYQSVREEGTLSSGSITIKGGQTKTVSATFKTGIESRDELNFFVEKYGVKYCYELKKFNIYRWYCSDTFTEGSA